MKTTSIHTAALILVLGALAATDGDVGGAAGELKIGRSTLYRRITALGISTSTPEGEDFTQEAG